MLKRICKDSFAAALLALVLVITSVTPALAYEDKYASDGNIEWRFSEDYYNGVYTLDNSQNGTTSTLTIFLLTQDVYWIDQMNILYDFVGKMNREDEFPSYDFNIEIGMPASYTTVSTTQFAEKDVNIKLLQVGIYPGYYNFYNYGWNDYHRSDKWLAITLSPNWLLFEDDKYKDRFNVTEDSFVEIEEGENKRLYVIAGERDFLEEAEEDFANWAIETEAHYIEESMANDSQEETEVEVSEENHENLPESAKPEIETSIETNERESEASAFEETPKPASEEKKDDSVSWSIIIIVFSAVAGIITLLLIINVLSRRKASRG